MEKNDAIIKANEFVRASTGIDCKPSLVKFDDRRNVWVIVYDCKNFFRDEIEVGAVIDGGEALVIVDCKTGVVRFESF